MVNTRNDGGKVQGARRGVASALFPQPSPSITS
jgi:hypothetical protein